MSDVQITTEEWDGDLPSFTREGKGSKYDALLTPAFEDRKARVSRFPAGTDAADVKAFARNLSHAANVKGYGCKTRIVEQDGAPAVVWQIGDKKVVTPKAAADATPAAAKKGSK